MSSCSCWSQSKGEARSHEGFPFPADTTSCLILSSSHSLTQASSHSMPTAPALLVSPALPRAGDSAPSPPPFSRWRQLLLLPIFLCSLPSFLPPVLTLLHPPPQRPSLPAAAHLPSPALTQLPSPIIGQPWISLSPFYGPALAP